MIMYCSFNHLGLPKHLDPQSKGEVTTKIITPGNDH